LFKQSAAENGFSFEPGCEGTNLNTKLRPNRMINAGIFVPGFAGTGLFLYSLRFAGFEYKLE
jgi:hypothetical protein